MKQAAGESSLRMLSWPVTWAATPVIPLPAKASSTKPSPLRQVVGQQLGNALRWNLSVVGMCVVGVSILARRHPRFGRFLNRSCAFAVKLQSTIGSSHHCSDEMSFHSQVAGRLVAVDHQLKRYQQMADQTGFAAGAIPWIERTNPGPEAKKRHQAIQEQPHIAGGFALLGLDLVTYASLPTV